MPIDTETRPDEAVNDPALPKILETLEDEIRENCTIRINEDRAALRRDAK